MVDIDDLKDISVFSGLNEEEFKATAKICKESKFKKGAIVIEQGDIEETLSILVQGSLQVDAKIPGFKDYVKICILKSKDTFGELAFIDGIPRSTTAKCLEGAAIIELYRADFNKLCKQNSNIELVVMRNLAVLVSRKLRDTTVQLRNRISKLPSRVISRTTRSIFSELADWMAGMKGFSSS
ncbi:cyclic nucleotide-binding domain-containing protein [candidate division WOR-3 bacterium]|nr:cyclic nucleotide-binding domain-containing protein [candidate division WOR-3 bacterium]